MFPYGYTIKRRLAKSFKELSVTRVRPALIILFILFLFILFLFIMVFPEPSQASGDESVRFFLMGDGRIHLRNAKNGREANVNFRNPDGTLNKVALTTIDSVFGFPTEEKGEHISLRLISMLDYFSDLVAPGKVIYLDSGYRNPAYNEKLKKSGGNVARTSTHIDGMAVDFYIEGVDGRKLWEIIRTENCCGVGHYGSKSVHLDAGRPRFWEAATSKVLTRESDFNRRIYLSSEYDRYRAGEKVHLSLSSVSDFGFGIKKRATIVKGHKDRGGDVEVASTNIESNDLAECILIRERRVSRFIYMTLPRNLTPGTYRIHIEFCECPFKEMPSSTLSNAIEVIAE